MVFTCSNKSIKFLKKIFVLNFTRPILSFPRRKPFRHSLDKILAISLDMNIRHSFTVSYLDSNDGSLETKKQNMKYFFKKSVII